MISFALSKIAVEFFVVVDLSVDFGRAEKYTNSMIEIKRIYEPASKDDGYRVLVDRLWSRGIAKAKAGIDLWLKDVAPSNDLRKWFGHDPKKWPEFRKKYWRELSLNKEAMDQLREIIKSRETVTLLYAARDQEHNEAIVIQEFLNENTC